MSSNQSSPAVGARGATLPDDESALLVGRLFDPSQNGPCVVTVRGDRLADITRFAPTTSELFERDDLVEFVSSVEPTTTWSLDEVLTSTFQRDSSLPHLLAPIDLQVIKAAGVTFARSLLERVIEERSKGDPAGAVEVRNKVIAAIDGTVSGVRPGSVEAEAVKQVLIKEGLWSQYLEVGIGPDPEIFTKAPVLSAVGTGAQIGILERSTWNNPEPEVVLVITRSGHVVGATLGNDVNLRDFEGRSALLLPEAKDNNASCAIGPFVRVFGPGFRLETVRDLEVEMTVMGVDGYKLHDTSSMREISRDIGSLVAHAYGRHHRYPDGFVLFTGTMFAPTQDRDEPGLGFTHHRGDVVRISSPLIGTLSNEVNTAEDAPDWDFGIRRLFQNLAERGLLRCVR